MSKPNVIFTAGKYRIVEEQNSVSGRKRYRVQARFLWFWKTCRKHFKALDFYENALLKEAQSAEKYVNKRLVEDAW